MELHLPWLIVFLPWGGAVVLALMPHGDGQRGRLPAAVNVGVAAASLVLALVVMGEEFGQQGWTRTDALNLPFVLVGAVIGLTTACFSFATVAAERFDDLRARAYHAAFQVFMGAQYLALLSDNLGVMWVAIEIATLASVLMVAVHGTAAAVEAAWKFFILCGVGIALALFGTILLYLAAQPVVGTGDPGLSWGALVAVASRCDPGVLSLAFVFLLVGYGTKAGLAPLHSWLPDAEAEGPLPINAVLSGLLLNAALFAVLRAKAIVGAHPGALPPGPLLVAFGLLSLLLAAFALWRRRDARRLLAWSSIEHMGLATFAFGIGGPAASLAGLLHMLGHSLVKSAAFFAVGAAAHLKGSQKIADIGGLATSHPGLGWALALAMAALAGLPPFTLFLSEFSMVVATAASQPWLLLPLGLGLLVAGGALVTAMQRLCLGEPTPDRPAEGAFALPGGLLWASIPTWLHLVLAALLALAAPAGLAALLRDGARMVG
ncbi:proton-conducting transporter transmembrane domain-containing protein [Falsiroseomonas stagni]|uniref:Hydrogenase-4 component F n=1 Tax=Falsiroseomonas stagni DSM 19981 TaxID=1123062 RepID=A0A1I4AAJ8_9PROT|nr:proton-conducting transporter membrane subunit [Falsiroseomonas stagni]SFK53333.1 hydrogenase-4 component F [Falsiroseomonas stagni DSM 19981]